MTGSPALDLQETGRGTRLRLRVRPGAKKNALLGVHGGALKLSVLASPEKGKANEAVLDLLAASLGVAVSSLELASGQASRDKTVLVALTAHEVMKRLGRFL